MAGLLKSRLFGRFAVRFFLWSVGFTLIPMIVLVGVSLGRLRTAVHNEALQRLMIAADDGHNRIDTYMRQIKEITQRSTTGPLVYATLETASPSPAQNTDALADHFRRELHAILGSGAEVSVLSRYGQVVASSQPRRVGLDCSKSEYFRRGEKATWLSDIFYDTLEQRTAWIVSSPVVGHDGALLGVVVNHIDPDQLTSVMSSGRSGSGDAATDLQPGSEERVYLVNRAGFLLTGAPFFPASLRSQAVDTKSIHYTHDTGKGWIGDYTDIRRVRVAGASEVIPELGWIVVAEKNYDQAMAPYTHFKNAILILCVAVFALTLVSVVRLGSIVVRPLHTLIRAEERLVNEGQAAALVAEDQIPDNEIGELIRRRNEVVQRVAAAEQRRQDLVDEIDGIAWEAEVGTWRFTFVSRRAEQILGYPVDQWLTEPGFWVQHLHPVDRSRTVQAYLEASITGKSLQLEYRMIASDGHAVWLRDQAHIVEDSVLADGRPVRQLSGLMIDITAAKQAQELLQESERRSRAIIEMSRDAIVGIDSKGDISVFNHAAEQMFQVPAREMIGTPSLRLVPEDLRDSYAKEISHYLGVGRPLGAVGAPKQSRGLRNDGSVFPMEISQRTTSDSSIRILATIQDIAARKKAEEELQRHYHQLDALHKLTDALIGAETVDEVYAQAMSCARLALQADRASIVLADPDGLMRTKASDGLSNRYQTLTEGELLWNAEESDPRLLIAPDVLSWDDRGGAIPRTSLSSAELEELRLLVLEEGIRALGAIPLVYKGRLLGRLMIYFNAPHEFPEPEIQLAQTIASHIAFAIGRQRATDVLHAIVEGTSPSTGSEFFRILVRHLANALHVRWAFIGESVDVGGRDKIRTLALWAGSDYAPNFEYDLAGTPCEGVIGRSMCCFPRDVAQVFPEDHLLVELGVEGYVGVRLSNSAGSSLGILVVMHDAPITEPSQAESILSVFAARAGAELQRTQSEQRLEREQQWHRSTPEQTGDPFFICDAETGRLIEASPPFQALFGYTREELLSLTLRDLGFDDPAPLEHHIQDHERGSHHTLSHLRCRRKDGTPADVEASTSMLVLNHQRALFVLVRPARREAASWGSNAAQDKDHSPVGAV